MIGVYQEKIKEIPSIVVVDTAKVNEALPMLTYFHGFTSAKEHNLPLAYLMAERGYRVILPDSLFHGEREVNISAAEKQLSFWDIVMQNVEELQEIKLYYGQLGLILDDRIGVAGTSMGGITTSATLTQYPWIKTAAILMGSPHITSYAEMLIQNFQDRGEALGVSKQEIDQLLKKLDSYDLSKQITTLKERPLLLWHGENDPIVPIKHSHDFYDQAIQHYKNPANIRFLKEADRDHKVSRYAILKTVEWFGKHL